jgi:hypothetical protein
MPTLHDYETAEVIREATHAELKASKEAAFRDGGAGVIEIELSARALRKANKERVRMGMPAAVNPVSCYAME